MRTQRDDQPLLAEADRPTLELLAALLLLPLGIALVSLVVPRSPLLAVGLPLFAAAALLVARRRLISVPGILGTLLLSLATFLPILAAYFWARGWGNVGWHNLMQLELIYSWQQGMDLSYYSPVITYPWLGLVPFAQLSRLFGVSPLHSYIFVNILLFTLWTWAYLAAARPHAGPVAARAAVPFTFLLSGIAAILYTYVRMHLGAAADPPIRLPAVELRVVPLYAKFVHLDAMTIGLVSLVFQYLLARTPGRPAFALGQLLGAQTILLYPSLGPIAVLVPLSQMLRARRVSRPWAAAFIGLVLLLLAMLVLFTGERVAPSVLPQLSPRRLLANIASALVIASPFLLVLGLAALRRRSLMPLLDILFILVTGAGAFVVLKMALDIQYKFLMGAMAITGVAVSAEIARILAARPPLARRVGAPLLAAGTLLLVLFWAAPTSPVRPPQMARAAGDLGGDYLVTSPDSRAVEAFLKAEDHAARRGLIISDSQFPAPVLLRRPMYIDLQDRRPEAGYEMPYRVIVVDVKGLGEPAFNRRHARGQAIVAGDAAAAQALLAETGFDYLLLLSDRPIACAGPATVVKRVPSVSGLPLPDLSVCLIDRKPQG